MLRRWSIALLVVAASLLRVHAQSVTWQGDNNGHPSDWSKNGNWTPSGRPTATQIAQFINVAVNTNPNINISGLAVGEVAFTSNALAYLISASNGNSLTINGIGGVGINNAASNTQTISSNIVLGGSQTWSVTNSSGLLAVSGVISGSQALTTNGAGTLTLSGANSYSGATTVSAGTATLTGSGSFASSPTVTVAAGATLNVAGVTGGANFAGGSFALAAGQTLAGSGTVSGSMVVQSTAAVSPGTGTARSTLTVGTTTIQAGSFFDVDIGSFTNLSDIDVLNIVGALTTNSLSTIRVHNQAGTTPTDQLTRNYTIALTTTGVTLAGVPSISATGFAAGDSFSLSTANGGRNLVLSYVPVPEPAAVLAVFAAGLGLFQGARRLRRPRPAK
jgi:autotransporter-associated beta strand protein